MVWSRNIFVYVELNVDQKIAPSQHLWNFCNIYSNPHDHSEKKLSLKNLNHAVNIWGF